ncbi:uncharacterized transporter slc-17.2-like [Schistocerca americana]|uniref:uncharacterized transporter slc-17.2-like n=1 Tax=Schistocerca americana TaxID=7009 RepID=UPI001F5033A0|nr:uncharacterized transporter slc-17.2-like [Schistocerca americana]
MASGPTVPWRRLLTSGPVWACATAVAGSLWGRAALLLAATKYLRHVYGFALTYDRVLSVLPHVGHVATAVLLAGLVDKARAQSLVSTTTARRLIVYIAHLPASALLFVLGYSGCDPAVPAALYTAAVVVTGATPAGATASCMDLAPNFAGVVLAVSQTVGAASSLAAAYVVSEGLHGSLPGSWRMVFGVSALVLTFTGIIFMGLGSGSVQPWNSVASDMQHQQQAQPSPSVPATPSPRQQQPREQQQQQQQQQQHTESAPQPLEVSTMMIAPATGGCIV